MRHKTDGTGSQYRPAIVSWMRAFGKNKEASSARCWSPAALFGPLLDAEQRTSLLRTLLLYKLNSSPDCCQ